MTPNQLEERLEVLDGILAVAMRANDPDASFDKIMDAIKTISYLQSMHMMHYALELLDDREDEEEGY